MIPPPTDTEQEMLGGVDDALSRSLALKAWWRDVDADDSYQERFPLTTTFNRPDSSFGFFSEARIPEALLPEGLGLGPMPVMGNVQEQFYDRPKTPAGRRPGEDISEHQRSAAYWMRDQIREFVLRYFMRISDFSAPEAYPQTSGTRIPAILRPLAWGDGGEARSRGFGYKQVFYKTLDGYIGRFVDDERYAIVDLRELRLKYAWVILKVEIFGFQFQMAPFGTDHAHGVVPLPQETYVIVSPDFIVDRERSVPGELGCYGFGYAFLPSSDKSLLGYGPGNFDVAFQTFEFDVREGGEVYSRMAFVANRPERIVNLPADPVEMGMRAADTMTFGLASRWMRPFIDPDGPPTATSGRVGPVDAYVGLANMVSGGMAARRLGITRKQLEVDFLVKHFLQHYNTVTGSLVTWRQIPDWLARDALPDWVESGISS